MEPETWVVAIGFGLAIGLYLGNRGEDLRAVQVVLALALAIGIVGWIFSPSDLAGPSLVAGGGAGLVGTIVTSRGVCT